MMRRMAPIFTSKVVNFGAGGQGRTILYVMSEADAREC